jgi:pyrrolidone-carboxylate peptidase
LPEQAALQGGDGSLPSLPLQAMVQGVRVALVTACGTQADVRVTGGAEN